MTKKYSTDDLINDTVAQFVKNHKIKTKNKIILNCIKKSSDITTDTIIDFKSVQKIFEGLICSEERKKHGIVYTPDIIVDYIVRRTVKKNTNTVCDPSCGTGVFLIKAVKRLHKLTGRRVSNIIENSVYGADILNSHIKYCKILLTLYMLYTGEDKDSLTFNLRVCDSTSFDWKKSHPHGFDAVIGNPPYIRIQDLSDAEKKRLTKKYHTCAGSYNLYFAFFEIGMSMLNETGSLGYVTASSFVTSSAGKTLRKWMQKYVDKILDFTHLILFEASSYTCVTFMDKKKKNKIGYNYVNEYDGLNDIHKIKFSDNMHKDLAYEKWRLLRSDERDIIQKIENTGRPLGVVADIRVGVATLKDKIYLITHSSEKLIKKSCIGITHYIENDITRDIIKMPDAVNWSHIPTHKIIFPYKLKNDKYELVPENTLKLKYPKCYEYLCSVKDVLASRDSGNKQYEEWYAYGRTQGFYIDGEKLLTPTFGKEPRFILDDGGSFFCNGYAVCNSDIPLKTLQKILNSNIMKYYIERTSTSVSGGYSCFQKNFIEKFGVPDLTEYEITEINMMSQKQVDEILKIKYDIVL